MVTINRFWSEWARSVQISTPVAILIQNSFCRELHVIRAYGNGLENNYSL